MSKILGIDISNNNGPINFAEVAANGVKFVYIKATEGKSFQDGMMETFYNECKANGLKVGAYHFLVASSSPEEQAGNFINELDGHDWDLIPMLDVETISGFTADMLCDYVSRFKKNFEAERSLELGIYSYSSFIDNLQGVSSEIAGMKFWEANYNNQPWNLQDNFFNNRIGHQYTESGIVTGVSEKCDVNEFTEDVLAVDKHWIFQDNKWWYKNDDGSFPKNEWKQVQGRWYRFDADGWMITGWFKDDKNEWYYLYNNGSMATGWLRDTQWYYLKQDTGVMAKDETLVIGAEKYSFGSNGHMESTNERGALI